MQNTVKRKIRWGTAFLFLLLLLSSGVGIYNLIRLKTDTNRIIRNNYESLDYCHSLQRLLDSSFREQKDFLHSFDSVLKKQESNITETGEREATGHLRHDFDRYVSGDTATLAQIRSGIQQVLLLNMSAIETKNEKATRTASNALTGISLIAAVILLIGLTFAFNFPYILTAPIGSLTEGIQQISRKNYQYRIHLDRKDEFGQMAQSFNEMAERLEYFENSNLNKLIFEKARAESVINSLREASIGIDKNDVVLFANQQALQLLGMNTTDLAGKPAAEVASRNDLFRFLLEEKSNLPFKIVIDDRENYFTKEVIEINQDGAASKVIVLQNITSFKELDAAKTNFIATISHELKTPLASSDFSIKLLEDERIGQLSPEQQELVQHLKQDNQRMLRILSELLNMAQVETGRIQLDMTSVNPSSLMDGAVASISNSAREKNITIRKEYAQDLPAVRADAEKTGWVLNNFLANAVKHAPAGSMIIVSLRSSGTGVEFSVSDEGPGIPEEFQSRVFERFFRVPGSKAAGTGLGLAISKEFIEAQQGHIWLKSKEGVGSEFGFTL